MKRFWLAIERTFKRGARFCSRRALRACGCPQCNFLLWVEGGGAEKMAREVMASINAAPPAEAPRTN